MKYFKRVLKITFFVLILGLMVSKLNIIFIRKASAKPMDMINKIAGYFNQERDYDLMFFGSSNTYCTFDARVLEEKGLSAYVLATQQQPLEATYYYIKEASKMSKPKVVYVDILDALTLNTITEGIAHSYTDYFPMGLNKILMIKDTLSADEWPEHILPLVKYHQRWQELGDDDFNASWSNYYDDLNGFVKLEGQSEKFVSNPDPPQVVVDNIKIGEDQSFRERKYPIIDKINNLGKENNLKVIFVKTPIYTQGLYDKNIESLSKYIADIGGEFYDFTKISKEADLKFEDYYDFMHLNDKGSKKFTEYFYNYYVSKDLN